MLKKVGQLKSDKKCGTTKKTGDPKSKTYLQTNKSQGVSEMTTEMLQAGHGKLENYI